MKPLTQVKVARRDGGVVDQSAHAGLTRRAAGVPNVTVTVQHRDIEYCDQQR